MLKLIGVIMVIGASSGLGFAMSQELKDRIEALIYIKKIMLMLRGEIKYMKSPLSEAFSNMAVRVNPPFSEFFKALSMELEELEGNPFSMIWKEKINKYLKGLRLLKHDYEQIERLGENFGYLDGEMQLNTIDLYIEQLEVEIKTAQETIGSKTRVYNCMGVMGGIFVAIIIF